MSSDDVIYQCRCPSAKIACDGAVPYVWVPRAMQTRLASFCHSDNTPYTDY